MNIFLVVRQRAGQSGVQNDADTPDVHQAIVALLAAVDFRGAVDFLEEQWNAMFRERVRAQQTVPTRVLRNECSPMILE